jgi:hypothetical protein
MAEISKVDDLGGIRVIPCRTVQTLQKQVNEREGFDLRPFILQPTCAARKAPIDRENMHNVKRYYSAMHLMEKSRCHLTGSCVPETAGPLDRVSEDFSGMTAVRSSASYAKSHSQGRSNVGYLR